MIVITTKCLRLSAVLLYDKGKNMIIDRQRSSVLSDYSDSDSVRIRHEDITIKRCNYLV